MALHIETFTNKGWRPGNNSGGSTLFKALGHPLTAERARAALVALSGHGAVAVYDPFGYAGHADSFYNLAALDIAGVFVQNRADVGKDILGHDARPVTELAATSCAAVLVAAGAFGSDVQLSLSDPSTLWIILACHAAMAIGTALGGWRIVKTMGMGLTQLKPVGGFCAEVAGAATLFGATFLKIPVSTTHTITGAIVGVGATRRLSAVRWGVAGRIVWAWVLTIPAAAAVAALTYFITARVAG